MAPAPAFQDHAAATAIAARIAPNEPDGEKLALSHALVMTTTPAYTAEAYSSPQRANAHRAAVYHANVLTEYIGAKLPPPQPGPRGQPGRKGAKGDGGRDGAQGQKGDVGEKGDKGDQGDKGEKGDAGEKGHKGEVGQRGEPGFRGEAGGLNESNWRELMSRFDNLENSVKNVDRKVDAVGRKVEDLGKIVNIRHVNVEARTTNLRRYHSGNPSRIPLQNASGATSPASHAPLRSVGDIDGLSEEDLKIFCTFYKVETISHEALKDFYLPSP